MFYRENVNYPELIWEDLAFQIDHRKDKRSRRENMPFPRFTKVVINYFLKRHNSLSNLKYQYYHTIKDDGIVSRLNFVRICKDYQEYGLLIPETMLTEAIKQSKSYQMFIKYFTIQIPPKKRKCKGSQGKKTTDTHVADGDVSKESDLEPPKRKTTRRRVVKKKVIISANDNIISDDPDFALELEEESGKVTFDPPKRLKGVPSLTLEEQEAADTIKLLKKVERPTEDNLVLEAQIKELVLYHGFSMSPHSSLLPQVKELGSEHERKYSEEDLLDDEDKDDKDGDADDEGDDHFSDTQDADDEDSDTKSDIDEIYNLSVSSGVGTQFFNSSYDISLTGSLSVQKVLVSVILETTNLPPIHEILTETLVSSVVSSPYVTPTISIVQQTSTPIPKPPITTDAPTTTTVVLESDALSVVQLRLAKLEKDMSELMKIDLSVKARVSLKTQVPSVVDNYLGSKVGDTPTVDLEQESKKNPSEILKIKKEQAEMQKMRKFTIKSTDKATLKEFDQKSTLYQTMHANKSFNRNPANHRLYHALIEALIEDKNAMEKVVDDTIKHHKRKHDEDDDDDDDEDPSAGPNQ
nr:hypothetical protein [Tanacetum cinerariifolium]GEZ24378.1 hypothetical protein [Tanacetum cinerariifolium]GEZ24397.1 hypothetical protein [Tanacetum cinerariifolium]